MHNNKNIYYLTVIIIIILQSLLLKLKISYLFCHLPWFLTSIAHIYILSAMYLYNYYYIKYFTTIYHLLTIYLLRYIGIGYLYLSAVSSIVLLASLLLIYLYRPTYGFLLLTYLLLTILAIR